MKIYHTNKHKSKFKPIDSRFCIKCGFEIKPIEPEFNRPNEAYSCMWNDGIVDKIAAGYGSNKDGSVYIIAICDDCIKDSKIEYIGDYM